MTSGDRKDASPRDAGKGRQPEALATLGAAARAGGRKPDDLGPRAAGDQGADEAIEGRPDRARVA